MGIAPKWRTPWRILREDDTSRKTTKISRKGKKGVGLRRGVAFNSYRRLFVITLTCMILTVAMAMWKVGMWNARTRRKAPVATNVGHREIPHERTLEDMLDAVVYVAIRPEGYSGWEGNAKANGGTGMLRLSIESLRKVGQYKGEIYVITDMEQVLDTLERQYGATLIHFGGLGRLDAAKGHYFNAVCDLKTKVFEFVPDTVATVLYLDSDIVVTTTLRPFLEEMQGVFDGKRGAKVPSMALFENNAPCGEGFPCWHAGILYMTRERSLPCLKAWHEYHSSYDYPLCISKLKTRTDTNTLPPECYDQSALSWANYVASPCNRFYKIKGDLHLKWMNSASLSVALTKLMANLRTFSHFTHNTRRNGHLGKGIRGWIYRSLVTRLFLSWRLGLKTPFDS